MVDELALDDVEVVELKELYDEVDAMGNGYVDWEAVLRHVGHTTREMPDLLEFFLQMSCPGCEDDLGRAFGTDETKAGEGGSFFGGPRRRRLHDPVRFGDFVRILGVYCLLDTRHMVKLCWNYADRDRGGTLFKPDMFRILHGIWSPLCGGDRLTLSMAMEKFMRKAKVGTRDNPFISFRAWKEICQRFPRMILPLRKLQYSLSTAFMGLEWWDKKKLALMKARDRIMKDLNIETRRKRAQALALMAETGGDEDEGDDLMEDEDD